MWRGVDHGTDKTKAAAQFEKLCETLSNVGLQTEVRNGDAQSVLLFVRVASDRHLFGEVYRSRSAAYTPLSHIADAHRI